MNVNRGIEDVQVFHVEGDRVRTPRTRHVYGNATSEVESFRVTPVDVRSQMDIVMQRKHVQRQSDVLRKWLRSWHCRCWFGYPMA